MSTKQNKENMDQEITPKESHQENNNLHDSDLDNVTGGAIPTPVNGQITDAVTYNYFPLAYAGGLFSLTNL